MTTPDPNPPKKPASASPLACTVLVHNTQIGRAKLAAGHKIHLPKEQAETLAGLTPPRVRIDGI